MALSSDVFELHRGRLFGIAYRMLGSATEADDVAQDAWVRWQGSDRAAVREPAAFLATIVTRLSLTALNSARARREVYVGPWLPEPVSTAGDPELLAEHSESLGLAVLLLLERLSPTERAAFLLHEAFDYPFQCGRGECRRERFRAAVGGSGRAGGVRRCACAGFRAPTARESAVAGSATPSYPHQPRSRAAAAGIWPDGFVGCGGCG